MNTYSFTVVADTEQAIYDAAHAEIIRFFNPIVAVHADDGELVGVKVDYTVTARGTSVARNARGEILHREVEADVEARW